MLTTAPPALTALALLISIPAYAQPPQAAGARRPEAIPSIGERTSGMKKMDGFFPMYWDEAGGRLFVEIPALNKLPPEGGRLDARLKVAGGAACER